MNSIQSAYEVIQAAYPFHVAAMCSDDAEAACRKNNLSFVDLLKPFCKPTLEGRIKDPFNLLHVVRNPSFRVMYYSNQFVPLAMARKIMSDAVSRNPPTSESIETTPWFDAYRDYFFQYLPLSDHELIRSFIACMIVVSSRNADPLEAYRKMTADQIQQQKQSSQPKWFFTNTFHYYVLIHDCIDGDNEKAEAIWESLRAAYGAQCCHFLKINSRLHGNETSNLPSPVNVPDPWSQYMHDSLPLDPIDMTSLNIAAPKASPTIRDLKQQLSLSISDQSLSVDTENTGSMEHLASDLHVSDQRQSDGDVFDTNQIKYGVSLTLSDHDRLRNFVHDFIVRGIFPYLEYMLRSLYDQVNSRKGLHGKFFSVTKKWFGSSKPTASTNTQSGLTEMAYANDSHEMQMRRLGDLAFLLQHYELAYNIYHSAKKEFNNDHAWLQFAGVAEMAAVSSFMLNNVQKPYPMHYMENAIGTYLSTCRLPLYATRSTFLSTEIMKAKGLFSDAAMAYIRVTSEDFDLRTALLLEQAAHCYDSVKPPMRRKFAFYLILAGHRFSKSGQRKHALRCYKLALQTYKEKLWHLAEDHINFTIGRHSYTLRNLADAVDAFRSLFKHQNLQPSSQQNLFLKDFLNVYKQRLAELQRFRESDNLIPDVQVPPSREILPDLPLPVIAQESTRTLLSECKSEDAMRGERKTDPEITYATSITLAQRYDPLRVKCWITLEEAIVSRKTKRDRHFLSNFRPSIQCFSTKTDNSTKPMCIVGEYIVIEVVMKNPMKISLFLGDTTIIWQHSTLVDSDAFGEKKTISNENCTEHEDVVEAETLDNVVLAQDEEKVIRLNLRPCKVGELNIVGIAYRLSNYTFALDSSGKRMPGSVGIYGKQDLQCRGPRLNSTLAERSDTIYGVDNRLNLNVVAHAPLLEVSFHNFPSKLLCGEIQQVMVELHNSGTGPLHNLHVASSCPGLFSFGDNKADNWSEKDVVYSKLPFIDHRTCQRPAKKTTNVIAVSLPETKLVAGCSVKLPLWIIGSSAPGIQEIDFLFYYEPVEPHASIRYRTLKHLAVVSISSSLNIKANACNTYQGEIESDVGSSNKVDLNQAVISLNIENLHQSPRYKSSSIDFRIIQISCISPDWSVYPIQPYQKDVTVAPKEKVLLCFKARNLKLGGNDTKDCTDISVLFSNISLKDNMELDSSSTPCSDFFFRSQCWYTLMPKVNKPSIFTPSADQNGRLRTKEVIDEKMESKPFDICLGLVVIWESDVEVDGDAITISGQHHVPVTFVIPITDDKEKRKSETSPARESEQRKRTQPGNVEKKKVAATSKAPPARPPAPSQIAPSSSSQQIKSAEDFRKRIVKYKLCYPSNIVHDFHNKRLCTVPVTLMLQNCKDEPVDVFINLTKTRNKHHGGSSNKQKSDTGLNNVHGEAATAFGLSATFTWVGNTAYSRVIPANGQLALSLMACFCVCNVYNLNKLQVLAALSRDRNEEKKKTTISAMTEQHACADSYIVISSVTRDSFELDESNISDIVNDTNDEE